MQIKNLVSGNSTKHVATNQTIKTMSKPMQSANQTIKTMSKSMQSTTQIGLASRINNPNKQSQSQPSSTYRIYVLCYNFC